MSQVAYLNAGKREQTKQANRQTILDAAREVFGQMGYEQATVRDIIRRTGLSIGAFYNYFRSKEEVFEALADDGARRFAPILRVEREKAADFEQFVTGAIRAYYRFLAEERANWMEARAPDEPGVHVYGETAEMRAVYGEVRAAIAEGIEAGGFEVDPDYLATACIGVAREVGDKMLQRRPIDTEGAAAFATAMILTGLKGLTHAT
jgi:AcrR family transcriptional regulator